MLVIALFIFALTYIAMLTEKIHKTVAALLGGCAMIFCHVLTQEQAFASIDLGVIFLLTGMMVIVHFLAQSGFFGYVAIRLAQIAKGRPIPLIVLLCVVTGALSALVDNVTTVLLIAPVTLLVAEQLEVSPMPYLMFEALASNVGGTATLIGDPPNILIGSASGMSFNQFLWNLGPVTVICLLAVVAFAVFTIRKQSHVSSDIRARVLDMNASRAITDRELLWKSGFVLGLVLVLFLAHGALHIQPATIAMGGAGLILLLAKADPEKAFKAVEWPTLFFFIGLFMLVGGLASTGLLEQMAHWGLSLTGSDPLLTCMGLLWFTAVASAILGCVPVVATLIPVIKTVIPVMVAQTSLQTVTVEHALWWSLALGACFGGNGTMFGTAANIVVVQIARNNRQQISFAGFLLYSVPIMLATVLIASIYIYFRYVP